MDMIEQLVSQLKSEIDARVPVQTVWAECVSVDLQEGTMTAVREELEYHDVLIGLGPDIKVPKPGAAVLLGIIENKPAAAFLLLADAYTVQRLNGDTHGGIPKAEAIASGFNVLVQHMNELKSLMSAWVPIPNDGGASLKLQLQSWINQVVQQVESQSLQNPSVTHGQ